MKYPQLHYHDYIGVDALTSLQKRRSEELLPEPVAEEMIFLITHQTYELWFKQMLFDLDRVLNIFSMNPVPEQKLGLSLQLLDRLGKIQNFINGQIDILETMTPMDFLDFRDLLYPASGFQSFQWRSLEIKLGLKKAERELFSNKSFESYLKKHQSTATTYLQDQKSLLELINSWLTRTPFLKTANFDFWASYQKSALEMLGEDLKTIQDNQNFTEEQKKRMLDMITHSQKTFKALESDDAFESVKSEFKFSRVSLQAALMILVYRELPVFQTPYRILQSLMNIDDAMTEWRHKHTLMVHRMLGHKIGTGGSSGHGYLQQATDKHKIFTDLFNLSTFLLPTARRPVLPESLLKQMTFNF